MTESTLLLLAAAAHQCWCDRMQQTGWEPGPEYSERARVHDALITFQALAPADQRRTLRTLRVEAVSDYLAELLNYPREEPRELQPEDMLLGREVELVEDLKPEGHHRASIRGQIVSWRVSERSGDLELVRIKWEDGDETVHTPAERELRLIVPPPPTSHPPARG